MNAQTIYIMEELMFDLQHFLDRNETRSAIDLLEAHPELLEEYKSQFAIQ